VVNLQSLLQWARKKYLVKLFAEQFQRQLLLHHLRQL
jgi:hypothetical protein